MNPNLACKDTNYFVSAIEITNNTLYRPHRESLLLTSLREPTTSLIANTHSSLSLIAKTHSSLSLIAGADPRSPKRKGDHIAQEMAGQARHEAKKRGSFLPFRAKHSQITQSLSDFRRLKTFQSLHGLFVINGK